MAKKYTQQDLDELQEKENEIRERLKKELEKENDKSFFSTVELSKKRKELQEISQTIKDLSIISNDDTKNIKDRIKAQKKLNELLGIEHKLSKEISSTNRMITISDDIDKISKSISKAYKGVKDFIKPWADADHAASKYAKTVAMTAAGMDTLRKNTISNVAKGIAGAFNMSNKELLEAQGNFIKSIGRNMQISNEDQIDIAALSKFENATEIAAKFENFGLNIGESSKRVGEMFNTTSKTGLSWEKYSSNLVKNIKIAQNYTFRDGLRGLENMAKKATAIKLDMQDVASFAEKVNSVEGAIETSAKLQVLGGPFASMADPMGMLNDSLNNIEGLQDRMSTMIRSLGTFDRKTGEVKVTGMNRRRIKAAADAMGVSYDNIMESVHASARKEEIKRQIESNANTKNLSEDLRELIQNQGIIKDGKAGIIDKDGKFKDLSSVSENDKNNLITRSKNDSDNIRDIAMNLRSLIDIEEGVEKGIEAQKANLFEKTGIGEGFSGILKSLSLSNKLLGVIAGASMVNTIVGAGGKLIKGAGKMFNGTKSVFKHGGKRGITRAVTKLGGKSAGKVATKAVSKVGSNLAKVGGLVGKGAVAGAGMLTGVGLIGAGGDILTDHLVNNGTIQKGGGWHYAGKMGSKALEYASIGALAGPIGAGIGAAIGLAHGAYQAKKAGSADVLDKILNEKNITRNGDYNAFRMDNIERGLRTGEMSESLRRALISKGDIAIVNEIDRVKKELDAKKESNKTNKIDLSNLHFGTANIKINHSNIDGNFTKVKEKTLKQENYNNKENQKNNTFDINLNGELKLVGEKGQSIDIIKYLNDHPIEFAKLTNLIKEKIGEIEFGTNRRNSIV